MHLLRLNGQNIFEVNQEKPIFGNIWPKNLNICCMSLDLMEIALDRMTDPDEFEKLATDILLNEGYYDIVPMPGGNDFGQDAIDDRFFESKNKTNRIVFQYSLQGNIKDKIA